MRWKGLSKDQGWEGDRGGKRVGLGFISNWEGMKKPYGNLLFYKIIKYIIYVFINLYSSNY